MALMFNWWVLDVLTLLSTLLAALYVYFKITFRYWEKRGVPYITPTIPFGNLSGTIVGKEHLGILCRKIYFQLEGHKYGGMFQSYQPTLLLRDLDIIKSFLVKDFTNFDSRGIHYDKEKDPLSAHLFLMGGPEWKELRTKLTPTFTSGKMKMMFETILRCGTELSECVRSRADLGETIEVKDLVARYSTDVIASCAFGIQCNCLRDPEAEFRLMGKAFFNRGLLAAIGNMLNVVAPSVAAGLNVGHTPEKVSDFFRKIVKETVEYRQDNDVTRNDFMQLLIQLKNKGFIDSGPAASGGTTHANKDADPTKRLSMDEVAAQAFVFFLAGFETSSTTVSFCLYQLAVNQDIQTRLRNEIDSVLANHGGALTYEAMMEMEYLGMVIDETLRMYPPVPILNRKCNRRYTVPGSGLIVEPGTQVIVPVFGLHFDPRYFPEPETFDPQRFTAENRATRSQYAYLPFGEGPRICIGMRFGYMQTKIALISLLTRYEFSLSEKTITPPVFDHKILILTTKDGLYLKVTNRA